MSVFAFGVLSVRIKYVFSRNNRYYFQKAVPTDLRGKYHGATIKVPLEATEPRQLALLAERLNRKYEAEFERLRSNPAATPGTLRGQAKDYLQQWGLKESAGIPMSAPTEVTPYDLLLDHLDNKRASYAEQAVAGGLFNTPDEAYRKSSADAFLNPVEREALQLIAGSRIPTFGEAALTLYLQDSGKSSNEKFCRDTTRAVQGFLEVTGGDRPIDQISRDDAKHYIHHELADGKKTGTIRRRLNTLSAVYLHWQKEKELDGRNPFSGLNIPGEGSDAKKRKPLNTDHRNTLAQLCQQADDEMRWLIALLADTGMRISEAAGLALSDFVMDSSIPHLVVKPHPWRSLKTPASQRMIPLVGLSLWAAQRIVSTAAVGQQAAFPRYCDLVSTSGDTASGALNAWMRAKGIPHTCHELRHTMADKLRDVQAGSDIIDMIMGWMNPAMRANYGKGHSLRICRDWLVKMLSHVEEDI